MTDVYQIVAERIIAALENGTVPWHKPWVFAGSTYNYATGRCYSLLNQLLLNRPGGYLTFRQAYEYGGIVKGAKSNIVVLWKPNDMKVRSDETNDSDKDNSDNSGRSSDTDKDHNYAPFLLKYYRVFHQSDVRGLKDLPIKKSFEWQDPERAKDLLQEYVIHEKIDLVSELSDASYYSPSADKIHLPLPEQFQTPASYYSTAYHEAIHSTGHSSRINRKGLIRPSFGSDAYSYEELIAELGSAMLLHTVGLNNEQELDQSSAYIAGWLNVLKEDKRAIVRACGEAQKAVKFILDSVGFLSDKITHYPVVADHSAANEMLHV